MDRHDATEQLCPSVCPKEMASLHESLLVICLWRKYGIPGNLTEETFGVREAIIHDTICQVQVPLAPAPPPTTLSQKQGTPLPFLLSSSFAGLVFLMRLYLYIMGDWVLFFSKDKRIDTCVQCGQP